MIDSAELGPGATPDRFDVFVSYAHNDNQPDEHGRRWVHGLRDQLVSDFQSFGRPLRVFLDSQAITSMDDWNRRILLGLRQSRVLLVCLSPNYFASPYCRMEFREYLARQARVGAGDESIAAVYFVPLPEASVESIKEWRERLLGVQHLDLLAWYPHGAQALETREVQERVRSLGTVLWERVDRAQRGERIDGNISPPNPYFIGRTDELRRLHNTLSAGNESAIAVINGIGGIGKTDLITQYAHAFRYAYPGGIWRIGAERATRLLSLVAALAIEPALLVLLTEEERANSEAAGREVVNRIRTRAKGAGPALLILDNVSESELLSVEQITQLRPGPDLAVAVTSRLGPSDFGGNRTSLSFVTVDRLSEDDGLALIRDHQEAGQDGIPRFRSSEDEAAAREIVRTLEGYTLCIEQIAVYLGFRGSASIPVTLTELRRYGVAALDKQVGGSSAFSQVARHQDRLIAIVLQQTLTSIDRDDRGASLALRIAAVLPPDGVPWPWLEEVLRREHPEMLQRAPFHPDPWVRIQQRLSGRRLITPTDIPSVGRMHRVLAAKINSSPGNFSGSVVALVESRARQIDAGETLSAWEYPALISALGHIDPTSPSWAATVDHVLDALEPFVLPSVLATLAERRFKRALCTSDRGRGPLEMRLDLIRAACRYSAMCAETSPARSKQLADDALKLALGETARGTGREGEEVLAAALHRVVNAAGPLPERREWADQAIKLGRRLLATDPGNASFRLGLAIALEDSVVANPGRGRAFLEPIALEVLRIVQPLGDAPDASPALRLRLASAWEALALATGAQDHDSPEGQIRRDRLARAVSIIRPVVVSQPGNLRAKSALMWALTQWLTMLVDDRSADALGFALGSEAAEVGRSLVAASPGRYRALEDFEYALMRWCMRLERAGSPNARDAATERVSLCRIMQAARPDRGTSSTMRALDMLSRVTADPSEAYEAALEALQLNRDELDPSSGWELTQIAVREAAVARCAVRLGQYPDADAHWRAALEASATDLNLHQFIAEESKVSLDPTSPVALKDAYARVEIDGDWGEVVTALEHLEAVSVVGLSPLLSKRLTEARNVLRAAR